LTHAPGDMAVTFTEKMHDPPPGNVAAGEPRLMTFVPATAVIVPPSQVPIKPFGVETTRPAGSVSIKVIPVSVRLTFGFVIRKLKVVLPPT